MIDDKDSLNKQIDYKKIKLKAANYCAYQERSPKQVMEKMIHWGLSEGKADQLLAELKEENFINEKRFATAFSRGKFYQNKWGKIKIRVHLQQHNIAEDITETALSEISDNDYHALIQTLCDQKWIRDKEQDLYRKKHKVARYLINKGFEPDIVWQQINEKYQ